jgi:hypothetical protein
MGNVEQHAGTIAGLIVRAFRAPVFHPFKNLKAPAQNAVGPAALYIRYKTDTAGIMFIFRPVHGEILLIEAALVSPLLTIAHKNSLLFTKLLFLIFIQK